MGNYVTVAEVKTFKYNGTNVVPAGCYSDAELENEIALAEAMIERITNDIFYSKTETNTFDGNGKYALFFAPRIPYKLLTVTSCKDIDINGQVLETFVENDDFVKYPHYLQTAVWESGDRPRRGIFRGGKWPTGQKNIVVAGTWGASTTPIEIKRAALLLTLQALKPGSVGLTTRDIVQASWPDFTVSFRQAGYAAGDQTGFAEIDRILSRYVNYSDMFLPTP